MTKLPEIKRAIVEIIKEARGAWGLSSNQVMIESIKKSEGGYKVTGTYKYYGLSGFLKEEGSFEIVLGNNLELVEVKIKAE